MKGYPTRLDHFDLGKWGKMRFMQWLFSDQALSFQEADVDRIAQLVPVGSFAIDIGAYTGDTTIPMAIASGSSGKVLAFEPGPGSFPLLVQNIALNKMDHVDVIHAAVTATDGDYTFHYVDEGFINGGFSLSTHVGPSGCGNNFPVQVHGVDLTSFLNAFYAKWLPKLSYVKIDAEGYDKEIVKANRELLLKYRPTLEVEVYPFLEKEERQDLIRALQDSGYQWADGDDQFFLPSPTVRNVLCQPK